MPLLQVTTNLSLHELPEGFVDELSKFTANMLGKPENRWYTTVSTNARMYTPGADPTQPFVLLQNQTIGTFDEQRNPGYGTKMLNFVSSKLEIGKDRVMFTMTPAHLLQAGLRTLPYTKMPGK